jgi:hypothetical protein
MKKRIAVRRTVKTFSQAPAAKKLWSALQHKPRPPPE